MGYKGYLQPTCLKCGLFVSFKNIPKWKCKKCGDLDYMDVEFYEDDDQYNY